MLKLAKIKQQFPHRNISSIEKEFSSILKSSKFNKAIKDRKRIAVAIGSRGISNIVMLIGQLIKYLKDSGFEPVIVPAMGSHGFATDDGQKMVLNNLGINEDTVGAKIISSMDVISLGEIVLSNHEYTVYTDQSTWHLTDGIILMNRIKPHTDYVGKYESGLVKMATVGLGNHKGAQQVHSLGTLGLKKLMPSLAKVILKENKIIGGFAIVEDAYHDTADLRWLDREEILHEEPKILNNAKSLMPKLPIKDIDLLIIKQMGKEISGVGIDPKIIGRLMIWGEPELPFPRIELIGVCDITDKSYGNALGIGLADFTTRVLFDKINFTALKENILTATFYQRGKIPLVLENEQEIIEVALEHFHRRGRESAKIILIKDTLNLSDMYVSEAVLDELNNRDDIEIISGLEEILFDDKNRIVVEF